MNRRGIRGNENVELAESVSHNASVESHCDFADLWVDVADIADVAVVDFFVVVVLDLHDLVAGREGPAEAFDFPFASGVENGLELDVEAVYRIDPDGSVTRVLSQPLIERPNGLAITPDARTLYVIDSHTRSGGNRKVWSFDVTENGKVSGQRLVFDFGRGRGGDGMRLDMQGNLWIAAGIWLSRHSGETSDVPPGIYVVTPAGELLGRIPIPEDLCTNLAFGGPERKTLFVTAGKTVFQIPLAISGYAIYPPG